MRRVMWRIVPFIFVLYVICYLDRANIGYAALQMNKELGLGAEAFGFASGVFFIGYFLFEVPSNIALAKYGAPVWIARILISWGIISVLTAFVHNEIQLCVLRFLLGVAEAGFFPGIIVYLTQWFRRKEQATVIALFTAAIPISYLLGAPFSTWLMAHAHWLGLTGWRWMIIFEGTPAIIGGFACLFFLVNRPEQARWLSAEEKLWLRAELEADRAAHPHARHLSTWRTLIDKKVLFLSAIYFVYETGSLGIGYWMPQIIKGFSHHVSITEVGLIAMIPYAVATISMIVWSYHSDKTKERRFHAALPLLLASVMLGLTELFGQPWEMLLLITLALTGLYAFKAPFWSLPSLFLSRETAAMSIAVINSLGNLGGFFGPYLLGVVKGQTGSTVIGLLFLSGLLMLAFLMTALMRFQNKQPG